jgi:S1-C subfamily serine protease
MKPTSFSRIWLVLFMVLALSGCAGLIQSEPVNQPASLTADDVRAIVESAVPAPAQPAVVSQPVVVDSDPQASLLAQQQTYIDVYEKVNPAVVNISIGNGQGSGFVYSQDGYIVTNNHVVEGASRIVVTFADDTQLDARLVGTDPDSDLAVIQVAAQPGQLTPVSLADSETLKVGQIVIAIGNPFGLENSMTTGIVSGLGRLLPSAVAPNGASYNIPDIIQTDAAINPGNSGGPLLDLYGNVIGVNSAIASPVRASSGVGYAIPANIVDVVVPQLIENGRIAHPWLGIAGGTLTADLAGSLGLDANQRGVFISSVTVNGPADKAGLRGGSNLAGDVIIGIEGQPVNEFDDLLGYIIQETKVGQTVTIRILRDGQSQEIPLTLEARPTAG